MLSMLRTSKDLLRCGPPAMLACSAWACAAGVAAAAPAAGVAAEAAGEVAEAGAVEDLEPTSVTKCNNRPIIFVPFFGGGLPPLTWTCSDATPPKNVWCKDALPHVLEIHWNCLLYLKYMPAGWIGWGLDVAAVASLVGLNIQVEYIINQRWFNWII